MGGIFLNDYSTKYANLPDHSFRDGNLELVEEPVSRTPPHLEPIVPDLGNRLKIKRFTWYGLTSE